MAVLTVTMCILFILVSRGFCRTCHDCKYLSVVDYDTAPVSDVDNDLNFLSLGSDSACVTAPSTTGTSLCSSGQSCSAENLNVTLNYSGVTVLLAFVLRSCKSVTSAGDSCYQDNDGSFSNITYSTQVTIEDLGLNVTSVSGAACLCTADSCNNNTDWSSSIATTTNTDTTSLATETTTSTTTSMATTTSSSSTTPAASSSSGSSSGGSSTWQNNRSSAARHHSKHYTVSCGIVIVLLWHFHCLQMFNYLKDVISCS